jgi:hypothetical protein
MGNLTEPILGSFIRVEHQKPLTRVIMRQDVALARKLGIY